MLIDPCSSRYICLVVVWVAFWIGLGLLPLIVVISLRRLFHHIALELRLLKICVPGVGEARSVPRGKGFGDEGVVR